MLYDLIIYRQKAEGEAVYLVECDKEVTTELLQTMKRYKIRKKVANYNLSHKQVEPHLHTTFWKPDSFTLSVHVMLLGI